MVLPTARKPEGGFQFISVVQLCALWTEYEAHRIGFFEMRVWCAVQEMQARRCQLMPGQKSKFQPAEWTALMGRRGGIRAAVARLQQVALLSWDGTSLAFPTPQIETNTCLATMLTQVPNHNRRIPVPRRLLRFLAKGCSRVLLATILGHLFRCLYYRQGRCRADGFCKASWIAEVFGVSVRAVKTARQRLEALGLLQRLETPQWVRNRYGQKMTINLQWKGCTSFTETARTNPLKTAPPQTSQLPSLAPLESNTELLPEITNQEPVCDRPRGVLSTLFAHARECARTGKCLSEDQSILATSPVTADLQRYVSAPPVLTVRPLPSPRLQHMLAVDLSDTQRLLALYTQARQAHLIGAAEAERLSFVALAQHVLSRHPANPGGLFRQLLRQRCVHFITQQDEDTALQRLKRHDYGEDPSSWSAAA